MKMDEQSLKSEALSQESSLAMVCMLFKMHSYS